MKKHKKSLQIIIIIGIIIKLLGLLYKIVITRTLSLEGMRIIAIITPTLGLLLTLSSLSTQTVVNQNVASKNNKISIVMKSALNITLIASSLITIFLLFSFPIYKKIYQNTFIYYPLLISIPLIYLSSINGILRGYIEGNEDFNCSYKANLYEQITKIALTFIALVLLKNHSIKLKIITIFLSLTLSEMVSFIYLTSKTVKKNKSKYLKTKTKGFEKNFLKQAIPLTLDQLILSLTAFLEPFIFYIATNKNNIPILTATTIYTQTSSYAIPLLTFGLFIIISISKITFPKITSNQNNPLKTYEIISKTLFISFPIAVINFILCKFHARESLNLLYNDFSSHNIVSFLAPFYFFTYFNPIFVVILESYKKEKKLMLITIISSISVLTLIYFLTNKTGTQSLILAIAISNIIRFILLLFESLKTIKYKPNILKIFSLLLTLSFYYYLNTLANNLYHFFLSTLIFSLLILLLYYWFFHKNKSH